MKTIVVKDHIDGEYYLSICVNDEDFDRAVRLLNIANHKWDFDEDGPFPDYLESVLIDAEIDFECYNGPDATLWA